MLFRIFCVPATSNVITTPPTYGMYKVCAKVNDVEVKEVPLTPDFQLRVDEMLKVREKERGHGRAYKSLFTYTDAVTSEATYVGDCFDGVRNSA